MERKRKFGNNLKKMKKGKKFVEKKKKASVRYVDVESLLGKRKAQTPESGTYFHLLHSTPKPNPESPTNTQDPHKSPSPSPSPEDQKDKDKEKEQNPNTNTKKKAEIMTHFSDLALSKYTKQGLSTGKFIVMTDIQRCILPHALGGRDILACSRTGSGKTLCFLIPVLESLYIHKASPMDGLLALVILPVRELALQIFHNLQLIGVNHVFSAGLLIGGKDYEQEKERVSNMNILIATPGRLLHHMNQSPEFDASAIKILVLDEVDRTLDMGFKDTVDQILANMPRNKQTMVFSATVSKNVKRLARLSMKNPEIISIHNYEEQEEIQKEDEMIQKGARKLVTPVKLVQHYMVVGAEEKLNVLFSFLKFHRNKKILVFFSSCKQVRFVYESFKKLKLNMTMMEMHGRQKQTKRTGIFFSFLKGKKAIMFATDIASRGFDFPEVDWVIQVDCPQDVDTYIHR
jgi:ATP-dependent RNA helicase DDX10/DBP4